MYQKYLAEFVGSAFLMYVVLSTGNVLAIGATYILLLLLTLNISGGFFNPMITIVIAMTNNLPRSDIFFYILAQLLGGVSALEIYKRVKAGSANA